MVNFFVKFQKTNAKFRILQIFAPSSFILKKCQQIENGVKLCKIPCLYIIFQNFTKKCTICFTHMLSADILSKFLVCYGVYICKIQADRQGLFTVIAQLSPVPTVERRICMVSGPRCAHLWRKIKVLTFEQKLFSEKSLFLTIYLIL